MLLLVKRRWRWFVGLAALACLLASAALVYLGQSPVTQANFDRIKNGMTEEEVTAILGKPT